MWVTVSTDQVLVVIVVSLSAVAVVSRVGVADFAHTVVARRGVVAMYEVVEAVVAQVVILEADRCPPNLACDEREVGVFRVVEAMAVRTGGLPVAADS